jgi:hypothetical protein
MESPTDYFRRWFHRRFRRWKCHVTVRLSQFESLGNSVSKIVWRHHAVAYFQTNCIPSRRHGRYIPTVSPTGLCCRYIPTNFEMELFPSVIITDGKIPSVIPLVFSGFLVVYRGETKVVKIAIQLWFYKSI